MQTQAKQTNIASTKTTI